MLIRFLKRRWPELSLLLLGIVLRAVSLRASPIASSFDFESHWKYIEWFHNHWQLPDCNWSRETFHPPLFYYLAGMVVRCGGAAGAVAAISVVAGCARLLLIWIGLELYLPQARAARLVGLALAALLPSSVHLDGMVGGEPLSGFFCALSLLIAPLLFRACGKRRMLWASALGLTLSLALMTKVSALIFLAAVAVCAVIEQFTGDSSWSQRLRHAAPLLLVPAIVLIATGWYFARNYRTQGHLFVTSFECRERFQVERRHSDQTPYYKRRPLAYYLGYTTDIYRFPYYPAATRPRSFFFPVLIATTFSDYYDFHFSPAPLPGGESVYVFRGPIRPTTLLLSCASVAGGTLIALATVAAWLSTFFSSMRRRVDLLVLLLVPLFALLGQLHFVTKYPFDDLGVVKGNYLLFAAPPLFGLFGLAVSWCWRRGVATRVLAGLLLTALASVGAYSIYCRFA